ncbi:GvpL/GvpF family gas vesicle protein [Streptomyces sp. NPDC050560]|uniref:GvpL/GvpF family gas vesicle protein n=1 Tax=Streptomyces sp. NPDC050560 TaxID=3365630 RepID=UPI00379688FD
MSGRVYVYGVVHAGRELPPRTGGVGRPPLPVRLLPVGELAAVVSDVPRDLRARRRDLTAHQDLLLALGSRGPVLPMRFGMVAEDEAAVRHAVGAAATAHRAALDRLGRRVEMNVKAAPVESGVAALMREDADVRHLFAAVRRRPSYDGNIRLGRAVAEGLDRRAAEAAREALPALAAEAVESTRGPEVPGCVLNVSFLVREGRLERFRATADRLAAAHRDRVELRLTGPLPCYSFTGDAAREAGAAEPGRTAVASGTPGA